MKRIFLLPRIYLLLLCAGLLAGCAAFTGNLAEERAVRLADGSTLYIDARGYMTMRDNAGHKLFMRDGEPMQAQDGTVIRMKENAFWKRWRTVGSLNPKL